LKSDLFENLGGRTYDIIISNPPYVSTEEMKSLPKEYSHEPEKALLAGLRGDEPISRILHDAAKHLSPKGILVVEVGNSAPLIVERYKNLPFVWLEFASGEGEVFLLTREELLDWIDH
jgi:ribosomal protein L3 glutamine methyltransferase